MSSTAAAMIAPVCTHVAFIKNPNIRPLPARDSSRSSNAFSSLALFVMGSHSNAPFVLVKSLYMFECTSKTCFMCELARYVSVLREDIVHMPECTVAYKRCASVRADLCRSLNWHTHLRHVHCTTVLIHAFNSSMTFGLMTYNDDSTASQSNASVSFH